MKRRVMLLPLVLCLLWGCGEKDPQKAPILCVSTEDCFLCGRGEESPWGQNNMGLISLSTFDMITVELNRYNGAGERLEEQLGTFHRQNLQSGEEGLRVSGIEDTDRGYAILTVTLGEDRTADREKAASFLCENCLERILPEGKEATGLGAVDLLTGEVKVFSNRTSGFGMGDFFLHCDWREGEELSLLIFYCPVRYGEKE